MTKYSNNYLILKKRIVVYSEIRQNFCNSVASHMSAFFQHFCWPVSDYRCFYWSTAVFLLYCLSASIPFGVSDCLYLTLGISDV